MRLLAGHGGLIGALLSGPDFLHPGHSTVPSITHSTSVFRNSSHGCQLAPRALGHGGMCAVRQASPRLSPGLQPPSPGLRRPGWSASCRGGQERSRKCQDWCCRGPLPPGPSPTALGSRGPVLAGGMVDGCGGFVCGRGKEGQLVSLRAGAPQIMSVVGAGKWFRPSGSKGNNVPETIVWNTPCNDRERLRGHSVAKYPPLWGRTVRCARAERSVGYFAPNSPRWPR